MNETMLTLVGNLVDAPTRRKLPSGASVTTFRVASTARRFDRETQRWSDGDSVFLRVSCWRQLADNAARSLAKGDPVVVTGRLSTRSYEVDGGSRASYELDATAVGFDLNRGTADFHRAARGGPTSVDLDADGMPAAPDLPVGVVSGPDPVDEPEIFVVDPDAEANRREPVGV